MTTTGLQLSTPLTNRIQRIEVSATMAVAAEAERLRASGVDIVDFGVGEPHFHTPQHIKDAAIAAINNNFSRYTAAGGTVELRDAIINATMPTSAQATSASNAWRLSAASTCFSTPSRCWSITAMKSSFPSLTGFHSRT